MQLILDNVSRCVSINLETAQIEITYKKHAKWKYVNLKKKTHTIFMIFWLIFKKGVFCTTAMKRSHDKFIDRN